MRYVWLVLAWLLAVTAATAEEKPYHFPAVFRYSEGDLVSGDWAYDFRQSGGGSIAGIKGRITGYAFGPGRSEIAYCTAAEKDAPAGLWLVAVPKEQVFQPTAKTLSEHPRRVWSAPAGVTLRGPIWWAPNGAKLAVRAVAGEASDLVVLDYLGGEPAWATKGAKVVDAAWDPQGRRLAYVTEAQGKRAVWLQTVPPGEAQRLGEGGYNLRWSVEGRGLHWYAATSEAEWSEFEWEGAAAQEVGKVPARPEGAMWSPDGLLCAAIAPDGGGEKQLTIYPTGSTKGEAIPLPDLGLRAVLGWTPTNDVVMVLGDMDLPFLVSVHPPCDKIRPELPAKLPVMPGADTHVEYSGERAALFGLPIDPEAGPPSWFADATMVAEVSAPKFDPRTPWVAESVAHGQPVIFQRELLIGIVGRSFVGYAAREDEQAAKTKVLTNVKNIAMALQMYASDFDAFPPATTSEELMKLLDEYVKNRSVWMRPGTEDDVIVHFLLPPGTRVEDLQNPAETEVVSIDTYRGYRIVGYADGSARALPKR